MYSRIARFMASDACKVKHMTIIGAGQMGAGIAQVTAQAGINVTMVDLDEKALSRGVSSIEKSMGRVLKKKFADQPEVAEEKIRDLMSRITTNTDVNAAAADSDLVCEAVAENLNLKINLFKSLDATCKSETIFASNTSSLSIEEIAVGCSADRQAKFGGLHFFNPVPMMKLLEVVKVDGMTSDATYNELMAYGGAVNKKTVTCRDTPGFIVNRLLVPYLFEAIRLHERGDGSKEDIDAAMKLGCGHPMGPFALADYVGLDTCKAIVDGWKENDPEAQLFEPSSLLNDLVAAGHYGMKSGQGFYNYKK